MICRKLHFIIELRVVLIFLITLFSNFIIGQDYPYRQYTINDGLPSNTIYSIKQSKNGIIWIATEKGVVRFDGIKFKVYTTNDGLASNDNFSLVVDDSNNAWVYSFKAISKISNKGVVDNILNTKSYYSHFFLNSKRIFFTLLDSIATSSSLSHYTNYVINDKKVDKISIPDGFFATSFCFPLDNDVFCLLRKNNVPPHYFLAKYDESLNIYKVDFKFRSEYNEEYSIIPEIVHYGNRIFVFSNTYFTNDSLILFRNKYSYPQGLIHNSSQILVNNTGWAYMIFNKGIYSFNLLKEIWKPIIKKENISSLYFDNEGNLWISTLGDGVYKYSSLYYDAGANGTLNILKSPVKLLNGHHGNEIWVADEKNNVSEIFTCKKYINSLQKDIRFIELDSLGNLYYGGNSAIYKNGKMFSNFPFKSASIFKDTLAITSAFGINFLQLKNLNPMIGFRNAQACDIEGRAYAVLKIKNLFYSGNQEGLFWGRPDKDELIPVCLDPELEAVSVNGIKKSSDGLLWVSTDGNGVYVVRDKEPVKHIEKELLDGNINSLKIDEKDQVWISTKYGVNKIVRTKDNVYEIKKYTSFHGLPSDYVNDTYCYNDTLYVATDAGLVRMDMKMIDQMDFDQPPPIYINNVVMTAGNSAVSLKTDSTYTLKHDQNSISVTYAGISFRSNGNIRYHYRLLPLNDNWRLTENDRVDMSDLGAGTYTFEVKAINALGNVSLKPATYSFVIKPHFTRTWWFITLSGVLFAGFIFLGIFSYFNYIRRRNQEKALIEKQLSQLKLQALQSQLNPHFIFNSLNAVQQLINEEDTEQANIYLARFAKLMRLYLEGADNQFITLRQELEVLKYYVQLEHLRFKDKFSYTIIIDENINLDNYQVPAMLMQPHVENAIRHGIARDIRTDRILSVSVQKHSSGVVVSVTDNGIGRKKSLELKQMKDAEHRSMGNKISKERLEMIRALKLAYIREVIIDMTDKDGQSLGTKVEIYISEPQPENKTHEP